MDDMVLVKDLPEALIKNVIQELACFTVAFLRIDQVTWSCDADLLGSGVLVSVGTRKAILTAHHVLEVLPTRGRIGMFLGQSTQPPSIDTAGISIMKIARGRDDSIGPDIGVVLLAPNIAASIGAKKSFFNLKTRREQQLNAPPDIRNGVWFAQGFLEERTLVATDPVEVGNTKYFYNFTGMAEPKAGQEIDGYDYFELPFSHEERSVAPVSWGGMSGGGLWQVQLKRRDGTLTHMPPVLSGIMFYQHPTTDTICSVRGHGKRTIYDVVYSQIEEREP
jgi:hypothetical protein